MKENRYSLIPILLAMLLVGISAHAGDLTTIKSNYVKILVPQKSSSDTILQDLILLPMEKQTGDQMVQELMYKYPLDTEKINGYLKLLCEDGSFSDINYKDEKRSSWEPKQHAERTLELCKLYASDTTPYYHDNKIKTIIHKLMSYWFRNMPVCRNWWQNEIGIPRTLGQAFLIVEDQLSEEERQGALAVMDKAHFGMTGQNKVWLASNMMIKGLLIDDESLVRQARDTIFSEITTEGVDGIQPDWSYHLHGPQQQFGNYGLAFLSSMSFFYRLFANTSYQMTEQQRAVLTNLVDKGYRWVIWHRKMDISSLGRQLFRNASTHKGYMTAFCAQDLGMSGFPLQGNPLVGHKHFPYSDYTVHRSPTWMASVKMHSKRTIGSEYVNEDNKRGFYLGDGATYYYIDQDDYMDILLCWDWRKVPGTTAYQSDIPVVQKNRNNRNSSDMVGGISEGLYGISAMDYSKDRLQARKAWFFTPDAVICLGADIRTDSLMSVTTSIDQRLAKGALICVSKDRQDTITEDRTFGKVRLFHDHIGYVMLQEGSLTAYSKNREGQWADNMGSCPPETEMRKITCMYLDHGQRPQNASYAYLVLPDTDIKTVSRFNEKDIEIVRNDAVCQVVGGKIMNNEYWGVFYSPCTIKVGKITFSVTEPGLYHFKKAGKKMEMLQALPSFRTL